MASLAARSAKFLTAASDDVSKDIIFGCNLTWLNISPLSGIQCIFVGLRRLSLTDSGLFMKYSLRWSATPGIPIIDTAVKFLTKGRFAQPRCAERLVVYTDPGILTMQDAIIPERSLKRLSPEEEHHAMILATARDLSGDCNVNEWAKIWLTQPVVFRCVRKLADLSGTVQDDLQAALFFEASQLREKIGEDFESMYLTTVHWLSLRENFEVLVAVTGHRLI